MRVAIPFGIFKHIIEALGKDWRSFLADSASFGGDGGRGSRACDLLGLHCDC